jgi:cytoskeletal protein RodZ
MVNPQGNRLGARLITVEDSVMGLATIRRNRGISLEQIADATKISLRALHAIEHGEFRKLPGGIYNTSYIRQYARAIDYDEAALLDYYYRETGANSGLAHSTDKSTVGNFRPASTLT